MTARENEIGVLKTIWKRDPVGGWAGHDIKGIDLKPRDGFSSDYFKIADGTLNLMTQRPGEIFENLFVTFGTPEFLVRQSIVPVVAWNDGDDEMRCIGTGFFVSASGLLLTAAHVLRDPVDEGYGRLTQIDKNTHRLDANLRFGILLPANPAMRTAPPFLLRSEEIRHSKWFMCPFEWAFHLGEEVPSPLLHQAPQLRLFSDIAICKVAQHPLIGPYQPLNIGLHNLAVGDRAVAIGYPEMRNMRFKDDDYQPELVVSVGAVTTIHPDNLTEKKNSTPGPNFEFTAKIPGKMSGSPILVGGGIITKGIVSRSWQDENHASGCLIAPMMGLPLIPMGGKTLAELQREGTEGIPHFLSGGL